MSVSLMRHAMLTLMLLLRHDSHDAFMMLIDDVAAAATPCHAITRRYAYAAISHALLSPCHALLTLCAPCCYASAMLQRIIATIAAYAYSACCHMLASASRQICCYALTLTLFTPPASLMFATPRHLPLHASHAFTARYPLPRRSLDDDAAISCYYADIFAVIRQRCHHVTTPHPHGIVAIRPRRCHYAMPYAAAMRLFCFARLRQCRHMLRAGLLAASATLPCLRHFRY